MDAPRDLVVHRLRVEKCNQAQHMWRHRHTVVEVLARRSGRVMQCGRELGFCLQQLLQTWHET
jgi:hypothetical protein